MSTSTIVTITAALPAAQSAGSHVSVRQPMPKYMSSLINLACSWSQATRPKIVGNMSDLAKQYRQDTAMPDRSSQDWETYCRGKQSKGCIAASVEKGTDMLLNMQKVLGSYSESDLRELVGGWVADTVYSKSYDGLVVVQPTVLEALSEVTGKPWREATSAEESKGIDGFVGDQAVQIKPAGWNKQNAAVNNVLPADAVPVIEYKKMKGGKELSINAPKLLYQQCRKKKAR